MVCCCIVVGCRNNMSKKTKVSGLSFHRFPADLQRKSRWIVAVRQANRVAVGTTREGSNVSSADWLPQAHHRLCNKHFIGGKVSNDPNSPAYIPTIFGLVSASRRRKHMRALKKYETMKAMRRKDRVKENSTVVPQECGEPGVIGTIKQEVPQECGEPDVMGTIKQEVSQEWGEPDVMGTIKIEPPDDMPVTDVMEDPLDVNIEVKQEPMDVSTAEDVTKQCQCDVGVTQSHLKQTERDTPQVLYIVNQRFQMEKVVKINTEVQTDIHGAYITAVSADNMALRCENLTLRDKVKKSSITEDGFESDEKVRCFTGLPSLQTVKLFVSQCSEHLRDTAALTKFQQVMLTLMRLHLNVSMQYLAYTFHVNAVTAYRIFNCVVSIMSEHLTDKHWVKANLPTKTQSKTEGKKRDNIYKI